MNQHSYMLVFSFSLAVGRLCLFIFFAGVSQFSAPPAYAGVASPYPWDKNQFSVCWYVGSATLNADFQAAYGADVSSKVSAPPDLYRKIISETVQDAYKLEKVGIEFTGWENCRDERPADIQLIYTSYPEVSLPHLDTREPRQTGGVSSHIGREHLRSRALHSSTGAKQQMYIHFSYTNPMRMHLNDALSLKYATMELQKLGLHEFCHMAGLFHETDDPITTPAGGRPVRYTDYDQRSIMAFGLTTKLSVGDIHTLSCLYGMEKVCPVKAAPRW